MRSLVLACLVVVLAPSISDAAECPIMDTAAPGATIGLAYTHTFTSDVAGATFTSTGDLPPGLALAATGELAGMPTTAGTYTFTVTVETPDDCTSFVEVTISVCPAITIAPPMLADATTQTPFDVTFVASGGTAPYTYALVDNIGIPGVTLAAATGAFTGTPTTSDAYTFTLQATDANSCVGAREYSVTIASCSIAIDPQTLPAPQTGVPYDVQLMTTGATGEVTYSLASGTLPDGVELIGDRLMGTPTSLAPASFTLRASDSGGCSGTRDYAITASCGAIQIMPPALDDGAQGEPYALQLTASGGTPPYTFLANNLPLGLAVDGDRIVGTPQSGAQQTVELIVTDALDCSAARGVPIMIEAADSGGILCSSSRRPGAGLFGLALLVGLRLRRRR